MLPAVAGFKFKEGENFNHRNTLSILRIALKPHFVQNVEPNAGTLVKLQRYLGKRGRFAKVSIFRMRTMRSKFRDLSFPIVPKVSDSQPHEPGYA